MALHPPRSIPLSHPVLAIAKIHGRCDLWGGAGIGDEVPLVDRPVSIGFSELGSHTALAKYPSLDRLGCVLMIRASLLCIVALILPIGGCGIDVDPSMLSSVNPMDDPLGDEGSSGALKELATTTSTKHWTPSNPTRGNPFRYPGENEDVPDSPKRESTTTSHVSVVGFANVGRPVVMLKIRDQAHSLAVGDKHSGIEVTDIAPPKVTLQMSNLVWTISMFDKSTH